MAEEASFLQNLLRHTADDLVNMAKQRNWPSIQIDEIIPAGKNPLQDRAAFYVWLAAEKLNLKTNYTPSDFEKIQQEHITKVLGGAPTPDIQEPT